MVTGGSSGLGLEIARTFLEHGATVAICGRDSDRLDRAAAHLRRDTDKTVHGFVCDVRDPVAVSSLRSDVENSVGAVTIVVNSAGANFRVRAQRMSLRALETSVAINLFGTFNVSHCFLEPMIARRRGVIASILVPDPERGYPFFSHTGAAKAAVLSLMRSWAVELGQFGIRTVTIGAGYVPTPGASANVGLAAREPFGDSALVAPLGNRGTADDIALAALFLCSPAAGWITGAHLNVDGGIAISDMTE